MDITFKTRKLEKTFNSFRELNKSFGENSDKIRKRMAVLRAAPSLGDVPHEKPIRRHELTGNRAAEFAVDLNHPFRLVFVPNNDPIPYKKDGGIDLFNVTSICITGVEYYH